MHAAVAAIHIPQDTLSAVYEDWQRADVGEKVRAALSLVEHLTLHPQDINSAYIEDLKGQGLDEQAMIEVVNIGVLFNFINRMADALDFKLPDAKGQKRLASFLNFVGTVQKPTPLSSDWCIGEDHVLRPTQLEVGRQHFFSTEGFISVSLRRAIEHEVVGLWGVQRPEAGAVPEALRAYIQKVSKSAYKIYDEEVEAIRQAGYSDPAIYEVTVIACFSACLVGAEAAFGAIFGE